jgi:hypothetical protein
MTPDQKKAHTLEINKLQNTLKPFFNRVLEPGEWLARTRMRSDGNDLGGKGRANSPP